MVIERYDTSLITNAAKKFLFFCLALLVIPFSSVPAQNAEPGWYADVTDFFGGEQQIVRQEVLRQPRKAKRVATHDDPNWYDQVSGYFEKPTPGEPVPIYDVIPQDVSPPEMRTTLKKTTDYLPAPQQPEHRQLEPYPARKVASSPIYPPQMGELPIYDNDMRPHDGLPQMVEAKPGTPNQHQKRHPLRDQFADGQEMVMYQDVLSNRGHTRMSEYPGLPDYDMVHGKYKDGDQGYGRDVTRRAMSKVRQAMREREPAMPDVAQAPTIHEMDGVVTDFGRVRNTTRRALFDESDDYFRADRALARARGTDYDNVPTEMFDKSPTRLNDKFADGQPSYVQGLPTEQPRHYANKDDYIDGLFPGSSSMGKTPFQVTDDQPEDLNEFIKQAFGDQDPNTGSVEMHETNPFMLAERDGGVEEGEALPVRKPAQFGGKPMLARGKWYPGEDDVKLAESEQILQELEEALNREKSGDRKALDPGQREQLLQDLRIELLIAEHEDGQKFSSEERKELVAELKKLISRDENIRLVDAGPDGIRGDKKEFVAPDGKPKPRLVYDDPSGMFQYFPVPHSRQVLAYQGGSMAEPYTWPSAFELSRAQAMGYNRGGRAGAYGASMPRSSAPYPSYRYYPHMNGAWNYGFRAYNPSFMPPVQIPDRTRAPQSYQQQSSVLENNRYPAFMSHSAEVKSTKKLTLPKLKHARVSQASDGRGNVKDKDSVADIVVTTRPDGTVSSSVSFDNSLKVFDIRSSNVGLSTGHMYSENDPAYESIRNYSNYPRNDDFDYSRAISSIENLDYSIVGSTDPVATFFFRDGRTSVAQKDLALINRIYRLYKKTGARVLIEAHASQRTSNLSPERQRIVNYEFSLKRAESLRDKLIRAGIKPGDIGINARGDSQPMYEESTPWGEAWNRRAVIYFR